MSHPWEGVAVAPLPSAPGHPSASLNVYWLLAVAAGSPHRVTANEFLRHCASPASDKLLTLRGGLGCRKSTWYEDEVNCTIPFYNALEGIHAHAHELPRLKSWSQLSVVPDRLITAAITTPNPSRHRSPERRPKPTRSSPPLFDFPPDGLRRRW